MGQQKKLNFADRGKNFLEFKREMLIIQIQKYWNEYNIQQKDFFLNFRKVMLKLNETYKEMGKKNLNMISIINRIAGFKPLIDLRYKKKAGIIIPSIDYQLLQERQLPAYSFEISSHYLDELIIILKKFFENLIESAEIEDLMLKFAFNFKKIDRRINALKNIIIPNLQGEIKTIKDILEEIEREEYVRLKLTKKIIRG